MKILEVHIYSAKSLKSRSLPLVRPLKFLDPPLSHVHYKSLTYTLSLQYRKNSKHIISLIIECALHSHLIRFNWTILSCRSQLPKKKKTPYPQPCKMYKNNFAEPLIAETLVKLFKWHFNWHPLGVNNDVLPKPSH